MPRTLPPALLLALAFAVASPALLVQPAHAQVGARAYAPEDLWTLSTADQTWDRGPQPWAMPKRNPASCTSRRAGKAPRRGGRSQFP